MAGTESITVPEGKADLTPQQTADLINDLIMRSQELLKEHPSIGSVQPKAKILLTVFGRGARVIVRRWKHFRISFLK